MILSEYKYAFLTDYKLEVFKRQVKELKFASKHIALMLSKVVSDIQKRLGVIELTAAYDTVSGQAAYSISAKLIRPKSVKCNDYVLEKTSTEWIKKQTSNVGQPRKYAMLQEGATAGIYLYPTPDAAGNDNLILQANYHFGLYSPNAGSSQDFGVFDGDDFTGNLTLPQQYDKAILLGMLAQIFDDIEVKYNREIDLLKVLQYNGEKFEYEWNDHTEKQDLQIPTTGSVSMVNNAVIDSADRYARITIVYGAGGTSTATIESSKGWSSTLTFADDGSTVTITSPDNQFSINTLALKNNDNVDVNRVSTSSITVDYFGDFGTLNLVILDWN